jgi:hypothetical protein
LRQGIDPKKQSKNSEKEDLWWTPEIQDLIRKRTRAERRHHSNPTEGTLIAFRQKHEPRLKIPDSKYSTEFIERKSKEELQIIIPGLGQGEEYNVPFSEAEMDDEHYEMLK